MKKGKVVAEEISREKGRFAHVLIFQSQKMLPMFDAKRNRVKCGV